MNISATELPNFIRKYYLLHELLIFKYWRQNISVTNIALRTAVRHSGVQPTENVIQTDSASVNLWKTPDFITPALWPANSLDLNPVDYQIWGKIQERVYRRQIRDVDQLKSHLIEKWEHLHQVFIDEAVRQWRPRLQACVLAHGGHFWTQTLGVLTSCHSHGRTVDSQSRVCLYWRVTHLSDLTKLAVAVAGVDQFYWNLVTCLPLNVSTFA